MERRAAERLGGSDLKAETSRDGRRLVYEVVLNEDEGNFKFAKTVLPDEAKAKLDQLVASIKADPKGAYFEIEGHTDNVGDPKTNDRIGLERAESVKRYLYEQHQIPLFKIKRDQLRRDKADRAQ